VVVLVEGKRVFCEVGVPVKGKRVFCEVGVPVKGKRVFTKNVNKHSKPIDKQWTTIEQCGRFFATKVQ
jgi:hypothetical protein